MQWQRLTTVAALVAALAAIAIWQWHEYKHERDSAREAVAGAADSVMNALIGGVRSHRRLGLFFSEQMQGMLEELVRSEDVLAVALVSQDGQQVFAAGTSDLLPLGAALPAGRYWDRDGFRQVEQVALPAQLAGPGGDGPRGRGGGRGRGRWEELSQPDAARSFSPGELATAVLLFDRNRADQAVRRAAWSRGLITAVSWCLVACVALTWRITVRLAAARGRASALEAAARHWRDLSHAAAGLAHETRNPLGLIRGWTQRLAEDCPGGPRIREQAQAVIEECDRLTARINQFLAFARPSEPQWQRFDPADVVAELANLLEPDLAAKNLTLRPLPAGNTLWADRELFRQVLFNLLQNALQASPAEGTVETWMTREKDGQMRLEVADRGPGVPADLVERLFTPYFTTHEGGNGLGLAIVRRIAVAHGWDVQYRPRPAGGAIFQLTGLHA